MTASQAGRNRRRRRARRRRAAIFGGILALTVLAVLVLVLCGGAFRDGPGTPAQDVPPAVLSEPGTEPSTEHGAPSDSHEAPPEDLPEGWTWLHTDPKDLQRGSLVLVNREHAIDPSLPDTVSVYGGKTDSYLVKDTVLAVTPETLGALNAWMDAFAAESGRTDVNVVAGWRSRGDQEVLYRNAVDTRGQAYADAYLALPGCSEHHTGLAVDLDTYDLESGLSYGFDGDGAYAWAVENAWVYGFIQRYPPEKSGITGISYESWHFRYVGLPHAWYMAEEDLCLEEYIDLLRSYPFSGEHLWVTCEGQRCEIYFCTGDRIPVPSDAAYTVSGNNVDGFIVTVYR